MRLIPLWSVFLLGFVTTATAGQLTAVIDKSDQLMTVYLDGTVTHQWSVSTGSQDRWTPTGTFGVQSMKTMHYSTRYHNAPMPWSVFFNGNIATHGTTDVKKLGKVASKGCVRLHPDNAKTLFRLIQKNGRSNTTIVVRN